MSAVLARLNAEDAIRANIEEHLRAEFMRALQGSLHSPATFAPRKHMGVVTNYVPDVSHVLWDAIDTRDFGPRAMQILVNAAAGRGTQRDAQQLIEEAVKRWASNEADFV
jgi:hypothetical protein